MDTPRPRRISIRRAAFITAGVLVSGCLIVGVFFGYEIYLQAVIGPKVEPRYGGEITAPYIQAGGKTIEPMTVSAIQPGSAFDAAGLVNNEIIVSHPRIGSLYKDLNQPAGTAIPLVVLPGGDGPALHQRPQRQVVVIAP